MSPSTIKMKATPLSLSSVVGRPEEEEDSIVGWCGMWMTLLLSVKKIVQKFFCESFVSFAGYRRICKEGMENNHLQQSWKLKLSFRNATILVCFFNIITFLLLLQGFLSALSNKRTTQDPEEMRYIMESEEIRRSLQPLDLIKRVREIEQEAYTEPEPVHQKFLKQAAAVDLSKRLKSPRGVNDGNTQKALAEWYKRKMERARQREHEKNGTVTSQA